MTPRISPDTLAFLGELKQKKTRDWFAHNKKRYDAARAEFIAFVEAVMQGLYAEVPELREQQAKDTLFRIYRDVRFSNDKRPYKDHICAYLCADGRKSIKPGYYLHIKPGGQSFLAGGAWFPPAPELKALRQEIDYNYDELQQLLSAPDFQKYFSGLEGDGLKTTPKGYEASHPAIDLLRRKSLNMSHALTDAQVLAADFLPYVITVLKAMKPVNDFLMRAYEPEV